MYAPQECDPLVITLCSVVLVGYFLKECMPIYHPTFVVHSWYMCGMVGDGCWMMGDV